MDNKSKLLALAKRLEQTALDMEAYSALIKKYNQTIKEKLKA
jgi:hypothetical protein